MGWNLRVISGNILSIVCVTRDIVGVKVVEILINGIRIRIDEI